MTRIYEMGIVKKIYNAYRTIKQGHIGKEHKEDYIKRRGILNILYDNRGSFWVCEKVKEEENKFLKLEELLSKDAMWAISQAKA